MPFEVEGHKKERKFPSSPPMIIIFSCPLKIWRRKWREGRGEIRNQGRGEKRKERREEREEERRGEERREEEKREKERRGEERKERRERRGGERREEWYPGIRREVASYATFPRDNGPRSPSTHPSLFSSFLSPLPFSSKSLCTSLPMSLFCEEERREE